MGNLISQMLCKIYPENLNEVETDTIGLLPSEIIKKEYIENEKNGIVNYNIVLKPSQIIEIENEKIKNLQT